MKLQRQHFLLSYLKTLSVGPVGVSNSQPPASQPGEQPSELPVGGISWLTLMVFQQNKLDDLIYMNGNRLHFLLRKIPFMDIMKECNL